MTLHCEKVSALLPLRDEGTLDRVTSWRLRRHLATCPACAAEQAAFAALDTRLRAADPAAPFAPFAPPADRSPLPVRLAPSLLRRRLLLGAVSAASLAAVGALGVSVFAPGKVAFAQVQAAMASVRTAEWTQTETTYFPWVVYHDTRTKRTKSVTIVSHVRARMAPPAILYEENGLDRETRERFTNTSLATPDDFRTYRSRTREISRMPMGPNNTHDSRTARLRAQILDKLTFTPPDTTATAAKDRAWETRKVTLGSRPALQFTMHETFQRGKPGGNTVTFTLWADPETKRVLRTEQEQRDARTGALLHRTVIENIRCDIPIPDSAFALHAPAGTPVYHENYWWARENSAKLTPDEKAQTNHLIDETYAGILASDWKRASAGWDLGYAAGLPGSPVPVGGLEKWLRGRVAEGQQYKMMRRQAVSGINDAPYVRVMGYGDATVPPGQPPLVAVTLTPGILYKDNGQALGTETFYFRRDPKEGFRLVGWQYPARLRALWRQQQQGKGK